MRAPQVLPLLEVPVLGHWHCTTFPVSVRADRSSVMRAALWVVGYLLVMCLPVLLAGVSSWRRGRRRRRGVLPRRAHPVLFARSREWVAREQEALAARLDVIKAAEGVVRAADARLGPLYECPVPPGESPVVRTAEVIVEAEHARAVSEEI